MLTKILPQECKNPNKTIDLAEVPSKCKMHLEDKRTHHRLEHGRYTYTALEASKSKLHEVKDNKMATERSDEIYRVPSIRGLPTYLERVLKIFSKKS